MDKKTTRALAQGLPLITQFGLSLAVPPAVCLFGAGWLRTQFCLGGTGGGRCGIRLWKLLLHYAAAGRGG